jgi:hypothetical protein
LNHLDDIRTKTSHLDRGDKTFFDVAAKVGMFWVARDRRKYKALAGLHLVDPESVNDYVVSQLRQLLD